jgi:hypothetical protein
LMRIPPVFLEKRLTRTSSAAAIGSARSCGLNGINHLKSGQYDGSPSAAGIG